MMLIPKIPKGSYSVMAKRGEPPDSLDDFPTPKWATRALMKYVMPELGCFGQYTIFDKKELTVLEPACGRGYMIEVLEGGMSNEGEGKQEIFYNEILAPDQIDRLFTPLCYNVIAL